MTRIIPPNGTLLKMLRVLNPCIFRYPPTPYFVEGVAPRDSGGKHRKDCKLLIPVTVTKMLTAAQEDIALQQNQL